MRYAIICSATLVFSLLAGIAFGQENSVLPDTLKPLHQSGWAWQIKGPIGDHSNETGKIVYRLTINSAGELISIDVVESTVSEATERLYRSATSKAIFTRVGDTANTVEQTSGIITYVIRNRDEDAPTGNDHTQKQKRGTKRTRTNLN